MPGSSNYLYILPAYLRALMIFLAVGAALEPNFRQKYSGELREAAGVLLSVHDTMKGGIVSIAAPSKDDLIPFTVLMTPMIGSAGDRYTGHSYWEYPSEGAMAILDYSRPYGAVNLYSGYNSVGGYPDPGLPLGYVGPFPPPHVGSNAWPSPIWYLGFYGKYLLRTLKRNKEVYREIGLPGVREVIIV